MKLIFRAFLIFLFYMNLNAKMSRTDSIEAKLPYAGIRDKTDLLIKLVNAYQYINSNKAIQFGYMGLDLARKSGYKSAEADLLGGLACCYVNIDNEKAIDYAFQSLKIRNRLEDRLEISNALNDIGIIYSSLGNYTAATGYHYRALAIRQELNDRDGIEQTYNNLALIFITINSYQQALKYVNLSSEIGTSLRDTVHLAITRLNMGDLHLRMGDYTQALKYLNEALNLNSHLENKKIIAYCLSKIGETYLGIGSPESALQFGNQSIAIYSGLQDINGMAISEELVGRAHLVMKHYDKAIKHAKLSFSYSKEIGFTEKLIDASNILNRAYAGIGNYALAYQYLNYSKKAKKSILNTGIRKNTDRLEIEYEIEKFEQKRAIELQRQKYAASILAGCAAILLLLAVYEYFAYRKKKEDGEKLSRLNQKLRELNSTKDRLFSIIAEDLRKPFQEITESSRLLKESPIESKERDGLIKLISQASKSAYNLLENLLLWSRYQTGALSLDPQKILLNKCLQESIELAGVNAARKRITIKTSLPAETYIGADSHTIAAVFRILISDAVKLMNRNGTLLIEAKEKGEFVQLSVADKSPEISQEAYSGIYEPDDCRNELDFTLCKNFVEANGGKISFNTELDSATRFILSLPSKTGK